jgi:hypothetical protein
MSIFPIQMPPAKNVQVLQSYNYVFHCSKCDLNICVHLLAIFTAEKYTKNLSKLKSASK